MSPGLTKGEATIVDDGSVKGPGRLGWGLGLRESHPCGKGMRKRKGLAPLGSALAHGGTQTSHRSGSQGRVLCGGKKTVSLLWGTKAETHQFSRLSSLTRGRF